MLDNDLLTLRMISDNLEDMMSEDGANEYRKCFDRVIDYCLHKSISKDIIKSKIHELNIDCLKCRFRGEICNELCKNNNCVINATTKSLKSLL